MLLLSYLSLSLSRPGSLLYFLSPVQLRRGSDRAALVGTWGPARLSHHTGTQPLRYHLWERRPLAWPHRTQPKLEKDPDFRLQVKQHWFYSFNKWLNILKGRVFTKISIGLRNWIGRPIFLPLVIVQLTIKETWLTKYTTLSE